MPLTPEQTTRIEELFDQFIQRRYKNLKELSIEKLSINPFLARLVSRSPVDLAAFLVQQHFNRSSVTSMGSLLQNIAKEIGTKYRPSSTPGADLEFVDEHLKRHVLMQMKAGPNTLNSDTKNEIKTRLNSAERKLRLDGLQRDWVVSKELGMAYGNLQERSGHVIDLGNQGFDVDKIGRHFWEAMTDSEDTYREVFKISEDIAFKYERTEGQSLSNLIEETTKSISEGIEAKYGDGIGGISWPRLLEGTM